jgi:transglutaminase-like putative cysteine protease
MKWEIKHLTRYEYASPVKDSFNDVRVSPISNEHQIVKSFFLRILPATRLQKYNDFYGNTVHHFEIPENHSTLNIESDAIVETKPPPLLAEDALVAPANEITKETSCFDFLQASQFVDVNPEIWRLAVDVTHGITDLWQRSLTIMRFVHTRLVYQPNSTNVHTHMRQALEQGRGVCQDFAHVTLGLCRCLQIPARYVSGYLATETASATHAWVEVFVPGVGWRALDPTHNRQTDATYIKLGTGRDYHDVSPVSGYYKGTIERKMQVTVKIRQVLE